MSAQNDYVLGRDFISSTRLNAQHYIWKEHIGYLLHPDIPIKDENLKVADIGTGTGAWLLDLSRQLPPTAQLDGFDIDIAQCPPKAWLPPNVSFEALDAFKSIPEHLIEKYDVVHIGIFILIVANNDPTPLLKNLMTMLKPGGHIQWNELDTASRKILASPPGTAEKLTALLDYVAPWENGLGPKSWVAKLDNTFSKSGLVDVKLDRFEMPRAYVKMDNDKNLVGYEEFSRKVLDPRGKGEGSKVRELLGEAALECRRDGVAFFCDMVVVVGRKGG